MTAVSTPIPTEQFLSFSIVNEVAILPTQKLTEVLTLTPQQIVPIAGLDPSVMGVCNWRGEVLWLVDLNLVLNGKPLPPLEGNHYSAILIHHNGQALGVVVSQIHQMLWCHPNGIQPIPRSQHHPDPSPLLQGYWISPQSETLLVLDVPELFLRFQN